MRCWFGNWDRFARSLKHLVNALAQFEALSVSFISLRDNLDLTTPAGRLMFQIIGAMAEFERSLIQERVRTGLGNARARRGRGWIVLAPQYPCRRSRGLLASKLFFGFVIIFIRRRIDGIVGSMN